VYRFVSKPASPKDFIKRVIGLRGDLIEIRDKELYINESLFREN
jgi:signal peptidase I